MRDDRLRQKVLKQLYDMVFSGNNDAAKLLFMDEEEVRLCIGRMDLRRVTSLHKAANGGIELKFCSLTELAQLLLQETAQPQDSGTGGGELLAAIDRAAGRLAGGDDEDEDEDEDEDKEAGEEEQPLPDAGPEGAGDQW